MLLADSRSLPTAPEPRDIHWFNLNLSASSVFVRQVLVVVTLLGLLSVWAIPVAALTQLLSWDTIQSIAPRFADLLEKSCVSLSPLFGPALAALD